MKYFLIFLFLLIIYTVFVEPNLLTVKRLKISDRDLKGLKIVFASDFHFKPFEKYRLKKTVNLINSNNPDVILLGGDYVNGHKKGASLDVEVIAKEFSKLHSKHGTFAVMGNHDGWQGKREIINAFENNCITVLENSNADLGGFVVAGVEDMQTANPSVEKALYGVEKPVILLSHTPDIIKDVPSQINLTLAGHTHGGQVVLPSKGPLVVPSQYGTKYAYGWKPDKKIFITKGLGTSILPIRFNCLPEIVVIAFE